MSKPSLLLILADRGRLLAYRVERNGQRSIPRLLESLEFTEGRQPLRELVTDKMGAFPTGGTAGHGNSASERMSIVEEYDTRAVRNLSVRIGQILEHHKPTVWAFAAPAGINSTIVDALPGHWEERLTENLALDLTRVPAADLLEHFDAA